MKHPRTTILGILTIVGAITNVASAMIHQQPIDWNQVGFSITAGVGLLSAADGNIVTNKLNGTYPPPPLTPK